MKKIIVSYILCSLLAFTLVGCGGISISFNSDDKASQKEVKQDQNQNTEDKSNTTDKSTQEEIKQNQDANNKDDKSNVTVNITPPQTQNNKDIVVIRDPIPVDISNGDFIFPNSDHAYLSKNQVSSLNNYQLGIARNEIYARHGYIFSLEQFRSYFSAQRWYTPITKDVTLNDIETYNVNLIKAEEDRRGIRWN